MLFDQDEFTRNGRTFIIRLPYEDWERTPWEDEDGHGPVSEWTTRDKRSGERVLHSDRRSHRYYDWQEAIKIAKRDGWGSKKFGWSRERPLSYYHFLLHHWRKPTRGEIAEAAVQEDFDRLRDWCNDEWCYIGVVVSLVEDRDRKRSLWGVESDSYDSIEEVANELADEINDELDAEDDARTTLEARELEASRPDMYGEW